MNPSKLEGVRVNLKYVHIHTYLHQAYAVPIVNVPLCITLDCTFSSPNNRHNAQCAIITHNAGLCNVRSDMTGFHLGIMLIAIKQIVDK